jgi:predicted enzyme related to lactoylglutathione lyase
MPEVSSYAAGTPSWVDLATSDPEGARRFYGGLFGWEFEIGEPEASYYTNCTVGGRKVAGMGGEPAPDGMPTAWTTYIASDDVDATAKLASDNGATVMVEPMDILQYGRMFVATDPTGAVFGAWQAGEHTGAEAVNEPGSVTWSELTTRDLDRAMDFYGSVFGYTWQPMEAPGARYMTFSVGDKVVGGSIQMDDAWPAEIPSHWMVYFAVADTRATVAKAEELGGAVSVPPVDTPQGTFAVLRDPQGGVFSVIEPRPPQPQPS